jgi:site-specific recombinase XerD
MKITLRTRKLKNGSQSLYLDICHAGKRRRENLELYLTKDKEQNREIKKLAEQIRSQRQLSLANDAYGFTTYNKKKINFIDYFENFANNQPKKYSKHFCVLQQLKKFARGKVYFQEIDEAWIERLKAFLLKQDISQNTAGQYLQLTKELLNKAVKEKIISRNPAEYVSLIKKTATQVEYLSAEQIQKLDQTEYEGSYDIKRAFIFCCYTGLRFSDVSKLTRNEISGDYLKLKQQKTGEYIEIPLHETAKSILKKNNVYSLADNAVFNLTGVGHSNKLLRKWFKKAEIDINAHWHISRHTFAVTLISSGADLYRVSKLMGHKNIKTTEIYAHLINEKKKEAVDNMPILCANT